MVLSLLGVGSQSIRLVVPSLTHPCSLPRNLALKKGVIALHHLKKFFSRLQGIFLEEAPQTYSDWLRIDLVGKVENSNAFKCIIIHTSDATPGHARPLSPEDPPSPCLALVAMAIHALHEISQGHILSFQYSACSLLLSLRVQLQIAILQSIYMIHYDSLWFYMHIFTQR